MADNNETLLIEIYKENSLAWRHDDSMLHRMTSLLLPISFTALAVPYVNTKIPVLLLLAGASILMIFWFLLCQILYIRIRIRFEVMGQIERHWCAPGHRHFQGIRDEIFIKEARGMLLYRVVFCVYSGVVIGIGLHQYDQKLFLPDCWLGIILFIIIVIIVWLVSSIAQRKITPCKSPTLRSIISLLKERKTD